MLTAQTIEKLHQLNLIGMLKALEDQASLPNVGDLSFDERFGMLVDREWDFRESRRLQRRLKEAKLRQQACIEDIDFRQPRGLDRSVVLSLSDCRWIKDGRNLLICGPTGSGKTFLSCAFGNKACRMGYKALYVRTPRLLYDVSLSKGDGSYASLMRKLEKTDLLILDDWGISPIGPEEARDILEVLEDRSQTRSTLVASQLPVGSWHDVISDKTLADAILDRLVHNAYRIELRGDSMRKVLARP